MRLLVDNALSPLVAEGLRQAGHDAVHVRDRIDPWSADEAVLDLAASEDRVLISADTDFGKILANRETSKPSFVLLRPIPQTIHDQISTLANNLPQLQIEIELGVVAVIEGFRVRVRRLPLQGPEI